MDHAGIDAQVDGNAGRAEPCSIVAPFIHQGIALGEDDERGSQARQILRGERRETPIVAI